VLPTMGMSVVPPGNGTLHGQFLVDLEGNYSDHFFGAGGNCNDRLET
jgi:hypothetical protein